MILNLPLGLNQLFEHYTYRFPDAWPFIPFRGKDISEQGFVLTVIGPTSVCQVFKPLSFTVIIADCSFSGVH
jgi:hypothetical protein